MPGISLVRLADKYVTASDRETIAPWLVALDENQDGKLEDLEVQDPKGYFRCGTWAGRIGSGTWRRLEKILTQSGLVLHKRRETCTKETKDPADYPVAPKGRFPVAYQSLFFSLPYDWVFVFNSDITVKDILKVLRPVARKIHHGKSEIEVIFDSGRKATIVMASKTQIKKVEYTDANGDYSLLARLEFLQVFRDANLFEKFFSKNAYYAEEGEVWQKLYSPIVTSTEVPVWSLKKAKRDYWKGILLFPDLHGNKTRYQELYHMLSEETLDWFALEMLSYKLQASVDEFLSEPERSEKYRQAKKRLQNYLQPFWSPYFKQFKDPDDNPYYRLLVLCRKRKIRVVALDSVATYSATSQTLSPLTVGTRNRVWAEHIPEEGRGIVYGGEAHFTRDRKARVQDFLLDQNSDRTIQRLSFYAKD
ncbi:MAG: hypothetical protein K8R69_07720 [Deltaproteobacteria bacterium]|nr:hypothetical protein [Deltaproteobacteria bacterium]